MWEGWPGPQRPLGVTQGPGLGSCELGDGAPVRACMQGSGPSGCQGCKCLDASEDQLWAPGQRVGPSLSAVKDTPAAGSEAPCPWALSTQPGQGLSLASFCSVQRPRVRRVALTCLIPGPASGLGTAGSRPPPSPRGGLAALPMCPAHPPALPFFPQVWEALSRRAVHPGASTAVLQVRPCPADAPAQPSRSHRPDSLPTPPGGVPPGTRLPVPTAAHPPCKGRRRGPRPPRSPHVTPEPSPSL